MQAYFVPSLEAIPPHMITAGARFAVPFAQLGGETLFEVYQVGNSRAGMGGLFDAFINIGTVAAQIGLQKSAASKANSQQERAINEQFDSLAKQVNAVFVAALNKGAGLTPADYAQCVAAYEQIASVAAQYPTKGITEWWNSPSYNASYQNMLATLQSRLTTGAGSTGTTGGGYVATNDPASGNSYVGGVKTPGTGGQPIAATGGMFDAILSNPYIVPALIVGVVLILKR